MSGIGSYWRRGLPLALLGAVLCLGALSLAQAQEGWKSGDDMHEAVADAVAAAKVLADIGDYGFKPGTCILGTLLAPDEEVTYTEELEAGRKYLIIGGGDKEVEDVAVWVTAGDEIIGKDGEEDGTPFVHFQCNEDAAVTVHLKLTDAPQGSFCALAILVEGGYDVPLDNLETAVANSLKFADTAAEKVQGASFLRQDDGWAVLGAILDEGQELTVGGIELPEGQHIILAAGDGQAQDVDIEVLTAEGAVVGKDEAEDAIPMVLYETQEGEHSLKLTNAAGKTSLIIMCLLEPPEG